MPKNEENASKVPELEAEMDKMLDTQEHLLEALKVRVAELEATIERMSASKLHLELRRLGIRYLVPTDRWAFLRIGTEKSLAALLLKLVNYDETVPLIVDHHANKGSKALAEFTEWAGEQAIFGLEVVAAPRPVTDDSALSLEPPIPQRAMHPEDVAPATPDGEDLGPQAPVDGPAHASVDENNVLDYDLQPAVPERETEHSRRGTAKPKEVTDGADTA